MIEQLQDLFWEYSQLLELQVGQRLGVYRHDAVLAEVPVRGGEGGQIWIRHTFDVTSSKRTVSHFSTATQ